MFQNMTAEYRAKGFVIEWDIGTTGNDGAWMTFQRSPVDVQADIAITMCRFI
jgi:hypothetical protein